jgi:hypothetical protein
MNTLIVIGLIVLAIALAFYAKGKKKKDESNVEVPTPTVLTPEQIEERKRLGEAYEQWKRDNNIKGP